MGNCLTSMLPKGIMGNFNILPEEIMLEIFSRVPTESVIKCKSVSKTWRNLLQHPSFPQMHFNHFNHLDSAYDSDGKLSFIFYTHESDEEPFSYSEYNESLNCFSGTKRINFRPPFKKYYILGSCNGIICFNTCPDNKDRHFQPAYICNPITREYIFLPKFEGKSFLSGFAYSPATNEYKVVRICKDKGDPNYGIIQVYTLGSGIGWRNGGKVDYDISSFGQLGVFVNGAIYWVNHIGYIVVFDLINEEFREFPSPPCFSRSGNVELVGVLGDCLCACFHSARGFDTWVLKKNKSNHDLIWSREFRNSYGRPIYFTKSGELLCYDSLDKNVYRDTPKASSSRTLVNFGKNFRFGVPHKNSLVSLRALGEHDTKLMDSGEIAKSRGGQKAVIFCQRNRMKKKMSK